MNMKKIMRQPLAVFGSIFLITTLLLVGVLLYQVKGITDGGKSSDNVIKPTPPIVEKVPDEYQLSDVATAYQKEVFEELVTAQHAYKDKYTELTKEEYATLVVKNFIADFYTWSNKTGRNDVGGVQFIAEEMRSTFRKQAIDGFYENLDFYLNDYEATSLITVNDVTILDVNLNDTLKTEDEMIDCISVQASWQYELSSSVEIEQFQSEATFILTESEDHLVLNAILWE